MRSLIVAIFLWLVMTPLGFAQEHADWKWLGKGAVRILVEVPPVEMPERERDELVASFRIDLESCFPGEAA